MNRRPFLQKLGILTTGTMTLPFFLYGKMQLPKETKFKFITASDGHFGQPNTDFETSHQKLIEALNREKDVDFVVFNGDLIHDDPTLMPEVKKVYDQVQHPYFVTRGNHDRVTTSEWDSIWNQPANFSEVHQEELGMLLLNCSNEAGDYLCADMDFAKEKLDSFQDLPHVAVFIHISQNEWTRHGIDCKDFMDLVSSYPNVRGIFHGHDHDVDGVMLYKKKPFLWSGHFGGNWGNPFPSYRVCEIGTDGKAVSYLKRVSDGEILSGYTL
ncbi:MAG: metallophosphoesterase [Algoriphagus sp.]|uniref:metallophosphoesterase family protein n=1 Tax=Algoriphagus sp. TaxID=1872435 RepID=UPI00180A0D2B|nr:metallophosphoesterase [Algoriphagus sp.]NVJ85828.1 metallophosphoesterase [Algoriphagus sp.]